MKNGQLEILIVPSWYPSTANAIAGKFIREQALALSQFCSVTVLHRTTAAETLPIFDEKVNFSLREIIVTDRKWGSEATDYLAYILRMITLARELKHKKFSPDIIHVHEYYAGFAGIAISILFGSSFVISFHHSRIASLKIRGLRKLMVKISAHFAKRVISVSSFLKKSLCALNIPSSKISVVPNTVDTNFFTPRDISNASADEIHILCIGALRDIKRVDKIIEAFANARTENPKLFLHIVGDGALRESLESLTERLQVDDSTIFHGVITGDILRILIYNSSFLVHAGCETFGVIFIEAAACGKPVVAFEHGAASEIVSPDIGVLAKADDVKSLTEAILYMANNYASFDPFKLHNAVEAQYSYSTVGKQLEKIYRDVIKSDNAI